MAIVRIAVTSAAGVLLLTIAPVFSQQAGMRVAQIPGLNAGPCNPGAEEQPWRNKSQTPECRALEVIAAMTPEEKAAEMNGITGQSRNARLGLIAGGGSDGPEGIASMRGAPAPGTRGADVTAFANAVTLAATWDRDLAAKFGKAMGEEFNGKGSNSILGPTINIMRTWHWGRNGETMSEDPYLTAEIAVPEIKSLQAEKVLTVLKHYAGNDQENTRIGVVPNHAGIDERITEKALHEIYLPAFKAAVERAKTGAMMCSYNQINGVFSCNNPELLGLARTWGFDGFFAPDAAFALRDPLTAALAGTTRGVTGVANLVEDGKLTQSQMDKMLFYDILPYFRLGIYDSPSQGKPDAKVSTPEHQRLSRQVAEEGAVLLKNQNSVLPIVADRVRTIAVIGDDAGPSSTVMINGSGHTHVETLSVPIEAIKARAGAAIKVVYARGTLGIGPLPALPASVLKPRNADGQGLLANYFNTADSTGVPVVSRVEENLENVTAPPAEFYTKQGLTPPAARGPGGGGAPAGAPGVAGRVGRGGGGRGAGGFGGAQTAWSARWLGTLTPPVTGTYRFSVTGAGTIQLYIDNRTVATMMRADFGQTVQGVIALQAGKPAPFEVKYSSASGLMNPGIALGWEPPNPEMRNEAITAARQADLAIVFAAEQMGEGQDKVALELPGGQDALIEAVAQANPRTVVVLHTSNPVSMPWLDRVAGVIEAFYPGQEAGSSIARVLFGDVNPSGRLAMTFPKDQSQGPATFFTEYPGDGMTANFDEGVFVGYRWYDAKGQEPLFPFGFGLSYTTFQYSDLQVSKSGDQTTVKVKVTNTGKLEGPEVVQLYIGCPAAAEEPPRQLRGFEKVRLKPGESKTVSMTLNKDSFAAWNSDDHAFEVYPGAYTIMVGASSRDIRLKGGVQY